ncbi:MAG: hypothetical protein KAX49_10685 [Halanaerobiales bacterium]|nr:hypothetical protein [Halanaerobiales bacterium]
MKRAIKSAIYFFLIMYIIHSLLSSTPVRAAWPEIDLIYYGKVNLLLGHADITGNETSLITQYGLSSGLNYDYEIDLNLEGMINSFDLESMIFYNNTDESTITFSLENQDWIIEYQPYNLKIPNLKTSFSTQKLDGFKTSRKDQTFHLFHGKKLFQPKSKTFTIINESEISYSLFNSIEGDVVEYSEIVFLQGEKLRRYVDYKLNYISGELKFLIPLHYGSIVEVKYNFIPIGESINDMLTGGYYQYNFKQWPGCNMSIFYLDDKQEVTVERIDDNNFLEEDKEIIHNRYYGSTININKGPLNLSGEYVRTNLSENDFDYAGNLNLNYFTPITHLNYQFTTATPDFTGVGVVSVVAGKKHQFSGDYKFDSQWSADLNLTQIIKGEDWAKTISQSAESKLSYQFNDKHSFSLSLNTNSIEEWGELITDLDYQLGWNYQITDKIILTLKDSLKNPEKGTVILKIKDPSLRLNSEYKQYPEIIPFYGEYWIREWNTDMTFRPFTGITLNGNIDYYQPFDASFEESQRRLALMLIASPNKYINTRSNYIYFFNPSIQSRTLFYDLNSSFILPYQIQLEGAAEMIEINSNTVINTDQDSRLRISYPIQNFNLSYQIEQDKKQVFLKENDEIYQDTDILTNTYSISYQITDHFNISLSHSNLKNVWILGTCMTDNEKLKSSVTLNYFKNLNLFKYQIDSQKTQTLNQLSHTLSWENKFNYLQYSYNGTLTHTLEQNRILNQNHLFKANLDHPSSHYKPSLYLQYQSQNQEANKWTKHKISFRLGYKLSDNQEIFSEIGHARNTNHLDPDKDYTATFIKLGVEYSF